MYYKITLRKYWHIYRLHIDTFPGHILLRRSVLTKGARFLRSGDKVWDRHVRIETGHVIDIKGFGRSIMTICYRYLNFNLCSFWYHHIALKEWVYLSRVSQKNHALTEDRWGILIPALHLRQWAIVVATPKLLSSCIFYD